MAKDNGKDTFKAEPPYGAGHAVETPFNRNQLTPADHRFLARTMRLLVSVQSRAFVRRARREGYTAVEHRQGWSLWMLAAGAERPLDHWYTEDAFENPLHSSEQLRLLQEIDTFENTWFPRARAIIRRVVPRDARDDFAAVFFRNLEQQSLGPNIIGAVATFLFRIEDLETTAAPHAKLVRSTLETRGLTKAKVKNVRELLEQATQLEIEASPPRSRAGNILDGQAAQFEALSKLRDWFNDWATSFRSVFNGAEQIQLGLTQPKRTAAADSLDEAADNDADEDEPPALESKRPESKQHGTIKIKTV